MRGARRLKDSERSTTQVDWFMPSSLTLSQYLPGLLLAAGVGMLAFIALLNLRAKISRRVTDHSPAREMIDEIKQRAQRAGRTKSVVESRIDESDANGESGVIEEDRATRRLIAQLDVRSRQIERLIRQADQRIEVLHSPPVETTVASISPSDVDRKTEISPQHNAAVTDANGTPETDGQEALVSTRTVHMEPATHDAVAADTHPIASESTANENRSSEPVDRDVADRESIDQLTSEVYHHADRGCSPVEIAKQLDEHVGKVELILALRDQASRTIASQA